METVVCFGSLSGNVLEVSRPLDWKALGVPEWWRCDTCGKRGPADTYCPHPRWSIDGPFSLRVGIAGTVADGYIKWEFDPSRRVENRVPAIVAVGTLTEDGHHADECCLHLPPPPPGKFRINFCGIADEPASPGIYHYLLSGVEWLDPPAPAEPERDRQCVECKAKMDGWNQSGNWHAADCTAGPDGYEPVTWQLADKKLVDKINKSLTNSLN